MRRHFVVSVETSSPAQEKQVKKAISDLSVGWWNWISNTWLISTDDEEITVQEIRDRIQEHAPKIRTLVLEVNPVKWSGYGPSSSTGKNMFRWLKQNWRR